MRVNAAGKQASTDAILKHGFAPPEQYQQGGGLGPWTDVYAMCATIYHCITAQVPPSAPARMLGDRDFEWSAIPELRSSMIRVLKKGTALRKADRYQSMTELRQALTSTGTGNDRYRIIKAIAAIAAAAAVVLGCLLPRHRLTPAEPPVTTAAPETTAAAAPPESTGVTAAPTAETTEPVPAPPAEVPVETQTDPILLGTPVAELTRMGSGNNSFGTDVILGRWKDSSGEYHEDSLRFWVRKKDGYKKLESVRYHLDDSHTEIFGTICGAAECDEGASMTVEIWIDGVIAYTSDPITRDSQFSFHVDFSDITQRYEWNSLIIQCFTESPANGYCIVEAWVN